MNLRKIIDDFGIRLENLGRMISQKDKGVKLEYVPTNHPQNVEVRSYNKYGKIINTTRLRVFLVSYFNNS